MTSPSKALASGFVAVFVPGCLALLPTAALPAKDTYASGRIMIEFAPGTSTPRMRQVQEQAGATPLTVIAGTIWAAKVPPGAEARTISRLIGDRAVLHAEPDYKIHDEMVGGFTPVPVHAGSRSHPVMPGRSPDRRIQGIPVPNPLYPAANGLPGQWGLRRILADQAWSVTQGAGVEVAVVDTGVDLGHPDLVNNLDVANGANFYDPSRDLKPDDDFGHGTHVAGIIAAQLGPLGTVGVAPQARVIPIRVLGIDGGTTQQLLEGLDHVLQTPARIVNLSLGSEQPSAIEQDEITKLEQKGIVVIAAAGNEALDGNPLEYPASYPGVVSVAATKPPDTTNAINAQYEHADFSNFDPFISVAAPGVDILSTVPRQFFSPASSQSSDEGAYAYASGTSMATPMVSGVAALILSAHPAWSAQQVTAQLLKSSGEPPSAGPGFSNFFGYGIVDAQGAVTQ